MGVEAGGCRVWWHAATGYLPSMNDRDEPVLPRFTPIAGDPTLELFGQGWTPHQDPARTSDAYQGRHRAPDL